MSRWLSDTADAGLLRLQGDARPARRDRLVSVVGQAVDRDAEDPRFERWGTALAVVGGLWLVWLAVRPLSLRRRSERDLDYAEERGT